MEDGLPACPTHRTRALKRGPKASDLAQPTSTESERETAILGAKVEVARPSQANCLSNSLCVPIQIHSITSPWRIPTARYWSLTRPQTLGRLELLETEGRMRGVADEQPVRLLRAKPHLGRQAGVATPKGRPRFGDHNLSGSSGSTGPSARAALTKASSFGRGRGSLRMRSQAASPSSGEADSFLSVRWCSNRAKSTSSPTLSAGSSWQMRTNSSVAPITG